MKLTGEAKLLVALGALVLFGVGFLILTSRGPTGPGGTQPTPTPRPSLNVTAALVDEMYSKARHTKGDPNAPLTIVEFADFECPSCRTAYEQNVKDIEKKLPVRFAFYHLPLDMHPRAIPAAVATEAAGKQGKFWEMYNQLFEPANVLLTDEVLEAAAKKIGLDITKFNADRQASDVADIPLKEREHALEHGIDTTPTFLIKDKNGNTTSVAGAGAFKELYDDLKDGVLSPKPAGPTAPGQAPGPPGPQAPAPATGP
jgi:Protein-disulfide isomerase